MERKTNVHAEDGRQEIVITREFQLPLNLLFKAYTEAELLELWMGNKVLKMECRPHGGYAFETKDKEGRTVFKANGVMHEFVPDSKITRTFEMENTPFPVQLEFLEFTALSHESSKLTMHIVYKSVAHRDMMLQMPFAEGINRAHSRLQKIMDDKK